MSANADEEQLHVSVSPKLKRALDEADQPTSEIVAEHLAPLTDDRGVQTTNEQREDETLVATEGICAYYCPCCGSSLRDDAETCPSCRKAVEVGR